MAKTFSELKVGDIVYRVTTCLSINPIIQDLVVKEIDCDGYTVCIRFENQIRKQYFILGKSSDKNEHASYFYTERRKAIVKANELIDETIDLLLKRKYEE